MNIKVVYHSSTGNTEKLASAIANTLHVTAESVSNSSVPVGEPIDLLFLGDGIYFGKLSKELAAYIDRLTPQAVKNVAIFATYGGQAKIGADMKALLQSKGFRVVTEPFLCRGKAWAIANRNHPSTEEIHNACLYAENVVATVAGS